MSTNTIVEEIKKNIASFKKEASREEVGKVIEVGDGIARLSGLSRCQASEMLEFVSENPDKTAETTYGLALNLEEETIGCVLLGDISILKKATRLNAPIVFCQYRSKRN
mgnify:CR=1 FL=1